MKRKIFGNPRKYAFTLIEMLVVVAIVGLLIGGIFKLMGLAGVMSKRAETIARMQRIQNALAGYYAAYGTYPPVKIYGSSNPYLKEVIKNGKISYEPVSSLSVENAMKAAAAQPIGFLYPTAEILEDYVSSYFAAMGMSVGSAAKVLGNAEGEVSWALYRLFQFGLLSFLVPRIDVVGGNYLFEAGDREWAPEESFFRTKQWVDSNVAKYPKGGANSAQLKNFRDKCQEERTACAKWITQLEKMISGQCYDALGTVLPEVGSTITLEVQTASSGTLYALQSSTILDGWGNPFFYHSPPPYHTYRIWSAGENGKTFPCWISYDAVKSQKGKKDATMMQEWISDDIIGTNQ